MRCLIVGVGVQGRKRRAVAGADVVATVDPIAPDANFKALEDVLKKLQSVEKRVHYACAA